ncbi:LysM peptidoglycan-binding domain-containing protein [Shewanella acanthi]|uniref:LysM peptidoglycan-binding domain-containing protein n=1 Tax=Shewanella acanthi TaxID=2864212 RepID=UPI001C6550AE|nr:LysM peptidoglycan-binding domain-containing protein [Shewanella acanthi]QYJ78426.1 LysM peptidoglycan-binding domain-containing protein [Shewanella acanthi]
MRKTFRHPHAFAALLLTLLAAHLGGCATSAAQPSQAEFDAVTPAIDTDHNSAQEHNSPLEEVVHEQYSDVWEKIQHANTIDVHDDAEVRKQRNFFDDKQKFMTQVAQRAEPFLYYIVSQLEARNMPLELALLPIVESGYNPLAQANGPAGLWQMIPSTGRNFGLTINAAYDGRKDALASTDAVLDYLQHLYNTLGKDWINAVAGYNSGELVIKAAIDRNKAKGKPTDFWSLNIPARQVQTVPKWLAFIQIIRSPNHYNLKVMPIANRPFLERLPAPNGVEIGQIASAAGLSKAEFKTYNPGFRQNIIPGKGKYKIALPIENIGQYQENQHQLAKAKHYDSQSYIVKSGDSLGSIAAKFDISVKELKQANNLTSDRIKIGQELTLLMPMGTEAEQHSASAKSNTNASSSKNTKEPTVKQTENFTVKASTYKVKSGDSLDKIARKNKVKLADLMKWNNLNAKSVIKPGQELKLSE